MFLRDHSVIVSSFALRISKFRLRRRHRISSSERHPRHTPKQSRRRKPDSFWKTMREHRFLGVNGAGGIEPAPDKTVSDWPEERPITSDNNRVVNQDR